MWRSNIKIRTANKSPKLKPLHVLEQRLKLRLGGSGVASMLTTYRYLRITQYSISFERPSIREFRTLISVGHKVFLHLERLKGRTTQLWYHPTHCLFWILSRCFRLFTNTMFLGWYSRSLKWCMILSKGFSLASTSYIYNAYVELG